MIRGPVVIDASVVVEYLVALRYPAEAGRVFAELLEPRMERELWAPDLLYPEVSSALRKLVRLGAIGATAGGRAVEQLTRLPLEVAGTAGLMAQAWALRDRLTVYDATYVALAQALQAPLFTADTRLRNSDLGGSVPIVHIADATA